MEKDPRGTAWPAEVGWAGTMGPGGVQRAVRISHAGATKEWQQSLEQGSGVMMGF